MGELRDMDSNKIKRTSGLMITDKDLRRRGSQRVLPEHVRATMEELRGVKPVLVTTKFITKTDLSKQHVRRSVPFAQFEEGLMRDGRLRVGVRRNADVLLAIVVVGYAVDTTLHL